MELTNWFFSLPLESAAFLVAMVGIIIGCIVVILTDTAVKAVVQHRIAGVDEFAYADDMFAMLSKPSDVIIRSNEEWHMIDMKSFTCTSCIAQNYCAFAFDLYNTDGDCIAAK